MTSSSDTSEPNHSAAADAPQPAEPDAGQRRKAIVSSFLGNFVEWFDYGAYSYLAVTIGSEFFPGDAANSTLMAFGLFAVAFLILSLIHI